MGELLSAWEIAEDRTMVLGELDDTCRITRASGVRGPMDPVTGQYPAAVRVTIYEGPCRFQIKPDMNANIIDGTSEGSVADLLVALVVFTVVGVVVTVLARRYDPQRRTVPPELPVRPGYPAAPPVAYSPGTTTAAPTEVRTAGVDGGTQGR